MPYNQVRITVEAGGFIPEFQAIICIPENVDEEEYIDDLLEEIIKEEVWENTVWDFCWKVGIRRAFAKGEYKMLLIQMGIFAVVPTAFLILSKTIKEEL